MFSLFVIPYWMFWHFVILGDNSRPVTRDELGRPRR